MQRPPPAKTSACVAKRAASDRSCRLATTARPSTCGAAPQQLHHRVLVVQVQMRRPARPAAAAAGPAPAGWRSRRAGARRRTGVRTSRAARLAHVHRLERRVAPPASRRLPSHIARVGALVGMARGQHGSMRADSRTASLRDCARKPRGVPASGGQSASGRPCISIAAALAAAAEPASVRKQGALARAVAADARTSIRPAAMSPVEALDQRAAHARRRSQVVVLVSSSFAPELMQLAEEHRHADQRHDRADRQLLRRDHGARQRIGQHKEAPPASARPAAARGGRGRRRSGSACGTIRPTKPMLPAVVTATAVSRPDAEEQALAQPAHVDAERGAASHAARAR